MDYSFAFSPFDPTSLAGATFRLGGITCRGGESMECSFGYIQVLTMLKVFQHQDDMMQDDAEEDDMDAEETMFYMGGF